jgi:phosphoribosylformylglycinamidine synthase
MRGFLGKTVPKVRAVQARKTFNAIAKAIDMGLLRTCHDLSEGGLAVAAAEMAFSGGYGVELHLQNVPIKGVNRDDFVLFSESNSRFLVEVSQKAKEDFEDLMKGKVFAEIGKVVKTPRLCIYGSDGDVIVDASLNDMLASWKRTLSSRV